MILACRICNFGFSLEQNQTLQNKMKNWKDNRNAMFNHEAFSIQIFFIFEKKTQNLLIKSFG